MPVVVGEYQLGVGFTGVYATVPPEILPRAETVPSVPYVKFALKVPPEAVFRIVIEKLYEERTGVTAETPLNSPIRISPAVAIEVPSTALVPVPDGTYVPPR
jgi:hypothetical protein